MINRVSQTIIAAVSLVLLVAATLSAQQSQQTPPQQSQQTPPPPSTDAQADISQQDLDKAALAFTKINQIVTELQGALQKAEDNERRQQMQENANAMMLKAVEDAGLTAEQYNAVVAYVRTSEERWAEFQQRVQNLNQNE